jgi:hypothetical protein
VVSGFYIFLVFISGLYSLILLRRAAGAEDNDAG